MYLDAERTPKGTVTAKAAGSTLVLPDVELKTNYGVVVGVAYDITNGSPTVKFGGTSLKKLIQRHDAVGGQGVSLWVKPQIWNGRIADIIATWSGDIGARAMWVTEIDNYTIVDVDKGNIQNPTTTPNTLYTDLVNYMPAFCIASHVGNGPVEDAQGTPDQGDDPVMSLGQRDGTTGSGFNVTIQETFATASDITPVPQVRSRLIGVTSRNYCSVVSVLRPNTMLRQGITTSDIIDCEVKFIELALDFENAMWGFNEALDRWELFDKNDVTTVLAHSNNKWK